MPTPSYPNAAAVTETVRRIGAARPARHRGYVPVERVASALGIPAARVMELTDPADVMYRASDCTLVIAPNSKIARAGR